MKNFNLASINSAINTLTSSIHDMQHKMDQLTLDDQKNIAGDSPYYETFLLNMTQRDSYFQTILQLREELFNLTRQRKFLMDMCIDYELEVEDRDHTNSSCTRRENQTPQDLKKVIEGFMKEAKESVCA